jgi:hypothetical protein
MSLRSFSKTSWRIDGSRVIVYPYRLYYILAVALAVIFAGLLSVYMIYENAGVNVWLPLALFLLFIAALFWGYGGTFIEFDNAQGVMRKKLFGFIPVINVPFNRLHGIKVVSNLSYGAYNYRMFKKDDKYGKGVQVSSGYGKNDDPNAVAFVNEVIPLIHQYLDQHDSQATVTEQPLTAYLYFSQEGGRYTIKKNKIAMVILGLLMFAFGVHEFTPAAWVNDLNLVGKACFLIFFVLGGPMIIVTAFTTVTFDQGTQTVERRSPIGLGNKSWSFRDFIGVQTVRRSVNMIYTGTDIEMYFIRPDNNKQEAIVVQNFKKSRNIERFVQELHQIIAVD